LVLSDQLLKLLFHRLHLLSKLCDSRVITALSIKLLIEKLLDFFVFLVYLNLSYFDLVSQATVLTSEFD